MQTSNVIEMKARKATVASDRVTRIAYVVGSAWAQSAFEGLTGEAKSVAVAMTRDLLALDDGVIAEHFGMRAAEVATVCTLTKTREKQEARFRSTYHFLRGACVTVLGLDEPATPDIRPCDSEAGDAA